MNHARLARRLLWAGLLAVLASSVATAASVPAAAPAAHLFHWRPFLAPFHSVVLHFPIGFLTMAGILELYRACRPSEDLRRVTVLVVGLGLLTGIISAGFGLMRAGSSEYEANMLALHRLYGLAVPAATAATLALQRWAYRNETTRPRTYSYRAALLGTLTLVVVAGHYGGNLTHGSNYLVEHAPDFVRELLEDDAEDPPGEAAASALDARERYYTEKVQPLLEAKCYKCHGAEKQKGGYRLDLPEPALKGGESGHPAIQPGNPMDSHLVRLILLPPQHDDVMPPEGRQPLTLEEIMTLLDWIRNGAVFPKRVTPTMGAAGG